jgi:hypothetical protein
MTNNDQQHSQRLSTYNTHVSSANLKLQLCAFPKFGVPKNSCCGARDDNLC